MDEAPSWEEIIVRARRHAFWVCFNRSELDVGDLEGSIIEACVRWPPRNKGYLALRCRAATADWFRSSFGRNSPTMQAVEMMILNEKAAFDDGQAEGDLVDTLAVDATTPESLLLEQEGFNSFVRIVGRVLREREQHIVLSHMHGIPMRIIGEKMGVSESRISQILKRSRAKLEPFKDMLTEV